jgi:ornithine decarboxylase
MTADSLEELTKIKNCFPRARVVVRIAVDDSKSACRFNTKFGAPRSEWESILASARALELDIVGFSYHLGSACGELQPFADAVALARTAFDMAIRHGFAPTVLDIGGGFFGHEDEALPRFEDVARTVSAAIDTHFDSSTDIIAEPGRYLCTASHTYAVEVIAKKADVGLYISDGVYGSLNCVVFDSAMKLVPIPLRRREDAVPTRLFGPTCDSIDVVAEAALLPRDLCVGEWIYFRNMGAYTRVAASHFNGHGAYTVHYAWMDADYL